MRQPNLKLTAYPVLLALLCVFCGCHYFYDQIGEVKRIPYPIPDSFPHETSGKIYRVWCGNELQIKSEFHTAYIILQGVNNPDRGEEIEKQAIAHLHSLLVEPDIKVTINALDERKRMIGQVYCGENHINLKMIKSGWGQYDGSDFDDAETFKAAQAQAVAEKKGMWKIEE